MVKTRLNTNLMAQISVMNSKNSIKLILIKSLRHNLFDKLRQGEQQMNMAYSCNIGLVSKSKVETVEAE